MLSTLTVSLCLLGSEEDVSHNRSFSKPLHLLSATRSTFVLKALSPSLRSLGLGFKVNMFWFFFLVEESFWVFFRIMSLKNKFIYSEIVL